MQNEKPISPVQFVFTPEEMKRYAEELLVLYDQFDENYHFSEKYPHLNQLLDMILTIKLLEIESTKD